MDHQQSGTCCPQACFRILDAFPTYLLSPILVHGPMKSQHSLGSQAVCKRSRHRPILQQPHFKPVRRCWTIRGSRSPLSIRKTFERLLSVQVSVPRRRHYAGRHNAWSLQPLRVGRKSYMFKAIGVSKKKPCSSERISGARTKVSLGMLKVWGGDVEIFLFWQSCLPHVVPSPPHLHSPPSGASVTPWALL